MSVQVKTPQELAVMREGGKRLIEVFKSLRQEIRPKATLKALEAVAVKEIRRLEGEPSFLGYQGYPAAICTSVNSGIVHCIPDDYQLQEGDLISVDCGFKYQGMHTDAAVSWIVGRDVHSYQPLLNATYRALRAGTQTIRAGAKVGEVSRAIEESLKGSGVTAMRQFVGHGVGRQLHEDPVVPNFVGHDQATILPAGSVIAIEPIASRGQDAYVTDRDGWSTKTVDSEVVAHFEQTVAVTPEGPEILTPIEEIIEAAS